MGLFSRVGNVTETMRRCTLDNKLYPVSEFYKGQPYNKSNDDFRRRLRDMSNGSIGTKQVRELFGKLRSVR